MWSKIPGTVSTTPTFHGKSSLNPRNHCYKKPLGHWQPPQEFMGWAVPPQENWATKYLGMLAGPPGFHVMSSPTPRKLFYKSPWRTGRPPRISWDEQSNPIKCATKVLGTLAGPPVVHGMSSPTPSKLCYKHPLENGRPPKNVMGWAFTPQGNIPTNFCRWHCFFGWDQQTHETLWKCHLYPGNNCWKLEPFTPVQFCFLGLGPQNPSNPGYEVTHHTKSPNKSPCAPRRLW